MAAGSAACGSPSLEWDVELPDRVSVPLGSRRPRGTVVLGPGRGDEERLSVPLAVAKVLAACRRSGSERPGSRAELLYLIRERSVDCASSRLARLVERRDSSKREASEKLRLDGYSAASIDEALGRACGAGMIEDGRFADVFIRTKVSAGWGARRIERELGAKGIDVGDLPGWPDEYLDVDEEPQRAYDIVSTRRIPERNAYPKLVRFLVGRGFSSSVASAAVRRVLEERGPEAS